MPGGGNSESTGSTSISGVSGPGVANGVVSDAVSRDGGTSVGDYGPGSSIAGSNGSHLPSVVEEKKKKSKSFWKKMLGK